ncbi:hypothetical protein HPB50_002487 [Hyalomma asiaticum]|uniref:Uncharacterized protein n=1 Tax=Hyalomma asiaticum TaxID=266040 RepID=A0ACB7SMG0_HYAAI|nr:hypothetical protein HPB50_002487 [Hyalomma asiaticum]
MGILPDDVLALFAGFSPSIGHARRMLKIVRAEVYRQIRLFRIHLGVQLHNSLESSVAGFQLRRYLQLAGQVTEVLWVPQLRYLRERVTRDTGGVVRVEGARTASYCTLLDNRGDCLFGVGDMDIHRHISPQLVRMHATPPGPCPLLGMLSRCYSATIVDEVLYGSAAKKECCIHFSKS